VGHHGDGPDDRHYDLYHDKATRTTSAMLLLRGGCQLIDNESLVIEFLSFRLARQSVWCETVRGGAQRERLGLLRADLGRAPCANPQGRRGARETESPG